MEVHYQNTPEEVAALAQVFPWWLRWWWATRWLVGLAACSVPATALLAILGMWSAVAAGWAAVGGLCLLFLVIGWMASRRTRDAIDARWLTPTTVRITVEYLEVESELGWSRRAWSAIDRIKKTPTHIMVFCGKLNAFAIPKRAFASLDQAREFAERAQGFCDLEQLWTPSTPTSVPSGGVRVVYQNTADELATVQHDGLQPSGRKQHKGSALLGTVILGLGGVLLAIGLRGAAWQVEAGVGIIVFLLVGIPPAALLHVLARRRSARDVEPSRLQQRQLTISSGGVHNVDPQCEAFSKWCGLTVEHDDRFIVLYYAKPNIGYLVPKRSFSSEDEACRFVEIAEAATTDVPSDSTPPLEAEDGNPYRPPASV